MRGRKCKKLREIGIIAGVVDDVKRNFKKGMIKNDQFKNQRMVLSISLDTFYSNKNYAARKI